MQVAGGEEVSYTQVCAFSVRSFLIFLDAVGSCLMFPSLGPCSDCGIQWDLVFQGMKFMNGNNVKSASQIWFGRSKNRIGWMEE